MLDLKVQFAHGGDKFHFPGHTESRRELEKILISFFPCACFIPSSLTGVATYVKDLTVKRAQSLFYSGNRILAEVGKCSYLPWADCFFPGGVYV